MRVLYLSRADQFDDRSSAVIVAKSVIKHMLDADPELFVSWVIPRSTKEEVLDEYVRQFMGESARRLEFVKIMAGLGGRTLGYFTNEELWYRLNQTKTEVPYDVLLVNQPALVPTYKTILWNRYKASQYNVKVPIVCWQWWTATHQQLGEVPEYYAGEGDVIAESMASLVADANVWESKFLYEAHLETLRQYLKPSALKHVIESSTIVHDGVNWPVLKNVFEARMERLGAGGQPCLFWGGRLSNQKKPRVTFPLMGKVQAATGCDVRISTNRPEADPDVAWTRETFPNWPLFVGQNRQQWFEHMKHGDVFVCNSPSESYGIAWLEMLSVGMLGVYEKAWWNDALMPEWYPFRSSSHEEQVQMATALIKQWPDGPLWAKYVPMVRKWIEEEHREEMCAEGTLKVMREQYEMALAADVERTWSVADLAARAAEDVAASHGEPVPEALVWQRMSALGESNREFGKKGDIMSRMYLRRALASRGWVDTCQSRAVEFRRAS